MSASATARTFIINPRLHASASDRVRQVQHDFAEFSPSPVRALGSRQRSGVRAHRAVTVCKKKHETSFVFVALNMRREAMKCLSTNVRTLGERLTEEFRGTPQ